MNTLVKAQRADLLDLAPRTDTFREDFCNGLRQQPKQVPPKYFYDAVGSLLFERICETEEYFVTRVEKVLLRRHLGEICRLIGPRARLVEFGSGNSEKTCLLLNCLPLLAAYVPMDISRKHLQTSASQLAEAYPHVELLPVCADYTAHFELPRPSCLFRRTVFFFPGSTIGNMTPDEALAFLRRVASESEPGDGFLIGIGLQTDPQVLERAYNDASGVTARFNLNLLRRACKELGAEIDLDAFAHEAIYDSQHARIEMRLVSLRAQVVRVGSETFSFRESEPLITEYSHKFTDAGFRRLAEAAGFRPMRSWSDQGQRMSIHYLVRGEASEGTIAERH
jgi:dimethylhistidine N-methyltransferase